MRTIARFSLLLLLSPAGVLAADATLGNGSAASCTSDALDSALDTVLSTGGLLDFDCGPDPITIPLLMGKDVQADSEIDGGGLVTIDAASSTAFFQVFFGRRFILRDLRLVNGVFQGQHPLENFGDTELTGVRMSGSSGNGAAIGNSGTLSVQGSVFEVNASSAGHGGAILNNGGSVTVSGSRFIGNQAQASGSRGGAIANASGSLVVSDSLFQGNASDRGGAIFCSGPATVQRSSFVANASSGNGGAIDSECTLGVDNSSFFENQADLLGGAIHHGGNAFQTAVLDHLTLVGNLAAAGAGIYNEGSGNSSLSIARSLLVDNVAGNCDGVLASGGYNISSDGNCSVFVQAGDAQNAAVALQALDQSAGPTPIRALAPDSPWLDLIPPGSCSLAIDQHGRARPAGAGCDPGAVEGTGFDGGIFADGFEPL